MENNKITASLVTYHTRPSDLIRLINCVLKSNISIFYIIDNSSDDRLREYADISEKIKYIHSLNLGFGHGHNIAIKLALATNSKYHVVINPDIYWNDRVIEELEKFMDNNPDCGQVMPKILYPNGNIQYLCKLLPTPMDLIGRRFMPFKGIQEKQDRKFELHESGYNRIMEIPSLSGCFMFLRTDILRKVGMFDERYFMYAEDLDLCRRIGEVSKTMFFPNVSVYHEYEKGSYKNKKLLKYHICSIVKYFNKWGWLFDKTRKERNRKCLYQIGLK